LMMHLKQGDITMTKYIVTLVAALTLAACETVQGAGQDISSAGNAVSNTAQDVQSDL